MDRATTRSDCARKQRTAVLDKREGRKICRTAVIKGSLQKREIDVPASTSWALNMGIHPYRALAGELNFNEGGYECAFFYRRQENGLSHRETGLSQGQNGYRGKMHVRGQPASAGGRRDQIGLFFFEFSLTKD